MDSCPKELEPFEKAHKNKIMEQDYLQHLWWGDYGISALIVAIDRCFSKKSKAEYIKENVMSKAFENDGLTEEEIYEKELRKALMVEEQWIITGKQKGLPETII